MTRPELVREPDLDDATEIIARAVHTEFAGGDRWDKAKPVVQRRFRAEAAAAKRALAEAGLLREDVDA